MKRFITIDETIISIKDILRVERYSDTTLHIHLKSLLGEKSEWHRYWIVEFETEQELIEAFYQLIKELA